MDVWLREPISSAKRRFTPAARCAKPTHGPRRGVLPERRRSGRTAPPPTSYAQATHSPHRITPRPPKSPRGNDLIAPRMRNRRYGKPPALPLDLYLSWMGSVIFSRSQLLVPVLCLCEAYLLMIREPLPRGVGLPKSERSSAIMRTVLL